MNSAAVQIAWNIREGQSLLDHVHVLQSIDATKNVMFIILLMLKRGKISDTWLHACVLATTP